LEKFDREIKNLGKERDSYMTKLKYLQRINENIKNENNNLTQELI